MSGGEHGVGIKEGTAADMKTRDLAGDYGRELAYRRFFAAYDLLRRGGYDRRGNDAYGDDRGDPKSYHCKNKEKKMLFNLGGLFAKKKKKKIASCVLI